MELEMFGRKIIIWGPAPDEEKNKIDLNDYDYIVVFNNYINIIEKLNMNQSLLTRRLKLIWYSNSCYPRLKGSRDKILRNLKYVYKIMGKIKGINKIKEHLSESCWEIHKNRVKDLIALKGRGKDLGINYICDWLKDKRLKIIKIVGITFYNERIIEKNYEKDYPTYQTLSTGNILDTNSAGHEISESICHFKKYLNNTYEISKKLKKIIKLEEKIVKYNTCIVYNRSDDFDIHINRNNFRMASRLRRGKLINILGNKYSKVLVVGNGPSLLNREMGEKINEYDIVIRLNDYKIKGYEKYVGNKTDIWFTGMGWQLEKRKINNIKSTLICSGKWYKRQDILRQIQKKIIPKVNEDKVNTQNIYYINNPSMFSIRVNGINKTFSTGLMALLIGINYFYHPITIVGFDGIIEKSKEHRSGLAMPHYYDRKTEVAKNVHDFSNERDILIQLKQYNKIKLLQ